MKREKEGNVVRDFYIGATRIKICDDYCRDKTPEDVEAILARIARQAQPRLAAAAEREDSAREGRGDGGTKMDKPNQNQGGLTPCKNRKKSPRPRWLSGQAYLG